MAKVCVTSKEFEPLSGDYVYFLTTILEKGMNTFVPYHQLED